MTAGLSPRLLGGSLHQSVSDASAEVLFENSPQGGFAKWS
jgi:hypothetical protein